ncbi:MAG: aminotransferase class I/II-fold pyridoxal phosphate-dependent enzyme [Lachnospiraceae bacterium]|nr:aminotransferase class I/II-fold pyridoxal phosphate-dependent enzyme [Lachnospiraceae bacterium]
MGKLREALEAYAARGLRSFHTPGHKGKFDPIDLTELPGLDDLHAPTGILKEAQERAAALYGADRAWYLVNGSTVGVLTALSAALPAGGKLLMQRESHRCAYNTAMLRGFEKYYLETEREAGCGAGLGVTLAEVRRGLSEYPDIQAVFLTSPNYEGFSAELKEIAELVHSRELPLIVDAAHGAHFGFDSLHPASALQCGADLAVVSLHKTLPSPTQTALLLQKGDRIEAAAVQEWLSVYQSTSPSYLLMAAMDDCIEYVSKLTEEDWEAYRRWRLAFRKELEALPGLRILDAFSEGEGPKPEPGKILLCPTDGRSGEELAEELRRRGMEPELVLPAYVLLITTVADR